jgi:hypothetical protein
VLFPSAALAIHLADSVPNWQLINGTQYKQVCCKPYNEVEKTLASTNCNDVVITVSIQIGRNHRETYN